MFRNVVIYSGDEVEASAIRSLFSDHATSGALAFSSTKVNSVIFVLVVIRILTWLYYSFYFFSHKSLTACVTFPSYVSSS